LEHQYLLLWLFPFLIDINHSFSKTNTGCCIIFLSSTEFIIWNVSTNDYCCNTQLYCCRIFVTKLLATLLPWHLFCKWTFHKYTKTALVLLLIKVM
jgi:hypothetical protein